jgi:hypothetical protein
MATEELRSVEFGKTNEKRREKRKSKKGRNKEKGKGREEYGDKL